MMNGYCSIGEAARLTGLSIKTIRHYANEGIVPPSGVSEAGYRHYSPDDLWRLSLVRLLRQLEFALPDIAKILNRSPDVPSILKLQKDALELQLRHLTHVRTVLNQVPEDIWGENSLAHLHTILEAMNMRADEKQQWLAEHWSDTMLQGAPENWKEAFLNQLSSQLPQEMSVEQAQAWAELKELLVDPEFKSTMQGAIRPFWNMIDKNPVEPESWGQSMGALVERMNAVYEKGHKPSDSEAQIVVDEWIALYAKTLNMPVNPEFIKRFSQYAEQMVSEPNRQLWDIMRRLNPNLTGYGSHEFMLNALRVKLSNLS